MSVLDIVVILVSLLTLLAAGVSGDPAITDNFDGTRAAEWTFETASDYSTGGSIRMEPNLVTLASVEGSVQFLGEKSLLENGSADASIVARDGWFQLAGHDSSLAVDGDFADPGPWTYESGAQGQLSSGWSDGSGRFNHSAGPTWRFFDSMDDPDPFTWNQFSTGGSSSIWSVDTSDRIEGSGSMRDDLSLLPGGSGGVYNETGVPWDFLPFPRIQGVFKADVGGVDLTLKLRARSSSWTTGPVAVAEAWTDLSFDLTSMGSDRASVDRLELRFSGVAGNFSVHIDSLRLVSDKLFSDTGAISQAFAKDWTSSPSPGSSALSYGLLVTDLDNVTIAAGRISIVRNGSLVWEKVVDFTETRMETLTLDVSSAMAPAGTYLLSFLASVGVDTPNATAAEIRVDDVSLLSPAYRSGSYETFAISVGDPAEWKTVNWTMESPPHTRILLKTRSGFSRNVGDGTWSPWITHANPAGAAIGSPGSRYIQVRVSLETSNESRTPSFYGFAISFSQYGSWGTVTTLSFRPGDGLLEWLQFEAVFDEPSDTSVQFFVSSGGPNWWKIQSGGDIVSQIHETIQVKAELSTSNTSVTPSVLRLGVTYKWAGPLTRIVILSVSSVVQLGSSTTFSAKGFDAYENEVPFSPFWSTDDPGRNITQDGVYTPGSAGTWRVCATSQDATVSTCTEVIVHERPLAVLGLGLAQLLGISALVGGAAAVGLVARARMLRAGRRMEDLFLIGGDGRLMLHMTLQLYPGRDEDVYAGMLTAINAFVRDSGGGTANLRTFKISDDFGDAEVRVERGNQIYAAAIYRPAEPPWASRDLARLVRDIEADYGSVLRDWSGDPSELRGLRSMTDEFVRNRRYRNHRRNRMAEASN